MSEATAFLRAVCAHPDEDGPRLVYADWLDERGDPKGEFIRAQCELARLDEFDPRRPTLARRAAELRRRYDLEWRAELPEIPGLNWGSYARGFVGSAVATEPGAFLDNMPAVFAAAPVQRLRFFGLDARRLDALLNEPALRQLRRLDLSNNGLREFGARALAEAAHLGDLVELDLHSNELNDLCAQALANSARLPRLTRLGLANNNDIGPAGVRELLAAPDKPLNGLDLSRFFDRSALAQEVSSCPKAVRLRELSLAGIRPDREHPERTGVHVGRPGVRALTGSPYLTNLDTLDLSYNGIGAAELEAFAAPPQLHRLTKLVLHGNSLGAATAVVWKVLARLPAVRHLVLSHNDLDDSAARSLAQSPLLGRLACLDLSLNDGQDGITPDGRAVLRESFGTRVKC
jgi:uncharacterized protein (TIGR02996 family)